MITKFEQFSGIINVNIDGNVLYFKLKYDENKFPFEIDLHIKNGKYDSLSVTIPDSNDLGNKEFFLNPEINKNIVRSLEKENFIQETGKESIAGDKPTKSYILLI